MVALRFRTGRRPTSQLLYIALTLPKPHNWLKKYVNDFNYTFPAPSFPTPDLLLENVVGCYSQMHEVITDVTCGLHLYRPMCI